MQNTRDMSHGRRSAPLPTHQRYKHIDVYTTCIALSWLRVYSHYEVRPTNCRVMSSQNLPCLSSLLPSLCLATYLSQVPLSARGPVPICTLRLHGLCVATATRNTGSESHVLLWVTCRFLLSNACTLYWPGLPLLRL